MFAQPHVDFPSPFKRGHAHNDYAHVRPLFDALDQGFCSIEADVFLVDGALQVGHSRQELSSSRTLRSLYLTPLFQRIAKRGSVYGDGSQVTLLVDIKADGEGVYRELQSELEPFRRYLTRLDHGRLVRGAVQVVLSGDRPIATVSSQRDRLVFIDGRLDDLKPGFDPLLCPMVSADFLATFARTGGSGGIRSAAFRDALATWIRVAHGYGAKLRFWGTPDEPAFWKLSYQAGLDWIGTDRLSEAATTVQSAETIRRSIFAIPNY